MLLPNVMPVGVGNGANATVLTMGTLRAASVGAVGSRDRGTLVARGVATLRDVSGSGLGATEGATAGGVSVERVGESGVARLERMLVN